jgi:hypothetical protein
MSFVSLPMNPCNLHLPEKDQHGGQQKGAPQKLMAWHQFLNILPFIIYFEKIKLREGISERFVPNLNSQQSLSPPIKANFGKDFPNNSRSIFSGDLLKISRFLTISGK